MPRPRQKHGALKRPASAAPTGHDDKRARPNDPAPEPTPAWDPQDFYNNVHVPSADQALWPQLDDGVPAGFLDCKLYPFQRRTVQFMIKREGARLDGNGDICVPPGPVPEMDIRGGILAEEMGLGKTVELIALISLHQRPMVTKGYPLVAIDGATPQRTTGATLIITPTHLVQQWKDEIALHAPNMRVVQYEGMKRGRGLTSDDFDHCDVVLTTYNVIAAEIWYVNPVQRDLRRAKRYVPPKSPLTEVEWWRVCLDEAQMVESAVSNTAVVARLIPRVNAWAVSGTPFKNQVEDLRGLLHFLRYAPFDNKNIWADIDKPTFAKIFSTIAVRHTKVMVRHELNLPRQKRLIISVPFMAIEEQNYTALFAAMCKDLGVRTDGTPLNDEVNLESEWSLAKMRTWLRRLRQTCLHPQVGSHNRRSLGDQPLRTVDEVVGAMIKKLNGIVFSCERDIVNGRVRRGHVHAFDGSNAKRAESSLAFYEGAVALAGPIVERGRAEDKAEKALDEAKDSKGLSIDLRLALEMLHTAHFFVATANFQMKDTLDKDSDEFRKREAAEKEHYDTAKTIRQELLLESRENAMKTMSRVAKAALSPLSESTMLEFSGGIEIGKHARRLEYILEIINQQAERLNKWSERARQILLKPLVDADDKNEDTGEEYDDSTKEQDELYILSLALKTIAAEQSTLVTGKVNSLTRYEAKQAFTVAKRKMEDLDDKLDEQKVFLAREVLKGEMTQGAADVMLADFQREHDEFIETPRLTVNTLHGWDSFHADDMGSLRGVILDLRTLLTKLEWQSRNPFGAITTTRSEAEAALIENLMKFSNDLATKISKALSELEANLDLFRTCTNQRLMFYKRLQDISDSVKPWKETLRPNLDETELRVIDKKEQNAEHVLAQESGRCRFLKHLRDHASEDDSRICVICQCSFENGVLTKCGHQYCKECINSWWLAHRTCPVCKQYLRSADFQDITYKPREYVAEEEDQPNAAVPSNTITPGASAGPASPPSSLRSKLYAEINKATLDQIKSIDLPASYGTKIDTLGRQLLWLRSHDPGAKAIVFSQFTDFLSVLQDALARFGVGAASIHESGGRGVDRFRRDPAVEVFLLDAKSNCSGLNLVNATHVFLCEPLVNPAVELQAIARVHRIGQMRPTCVWMSLVQDSVEGCVYDISVGRRLAHLDKRRRESEAGESEDGDAVARQQEQEDPSPARGAEETDADAAMDAADSLELQGAPVARLLDRARLPAAAKGSVGGSGEVVAQGDLWACLFTGRPRAPAGGDVPATAAQGALGTEVRRYLVGSAAEARLTADEAAEASRIAVEARREFENGMYD